ncbi:hypothetical protein BC567DRAFT_213012 [Phyllosticta citribraziliensis]
MQKTNKNKTYLPQKENPTSPAYLLDYIVSPLTTHFTGPERAPALRCRLCEDQRPQQASTVATQTVVPLQSRWPNCPSKYPPPRPDQYTRCRKPKGCCLEPEATATAAYESHTTLCANAPTIPLASLSAADATNFLTDRGRERRRYQERGAPQNVGWSRHLHSLRGLAAPRGTHDYWKLSIEAPVPIKKNEHGPPLSMSMKLASSEPNIVSAAMRPLWCALYSPDANETAIDARLCLLVLTAMAVVAAFHSVLLIFSGSKMVKLCTSSTTLTPARQDCGQCSRMTVLVASNVAAAAVSTGNAHGKQHSLLPSGLCAAHSFLDD